jgi:type I restriction enzyme M protein
MLIVSHYHVRGKYGGEKAKELSLYGQGANPKIYALCKMNLYIHDIRDVELRQGDTLLYPKFLERYLKGLR